MTVDNEIHAAIARHDTTALRRMAKEKQDQEAQMFLTLLADIIDRHLKQGVELKKKSPQLGSSQPAGQVTAA